MISKIESLTICGPQDDEFSCPVAQPDEQSTLPAAKPILNDVPPPAGDNDGGGGGDSAPGGGSGGGDQEPETVNTTAEVTSRSISPTPQNTGAPEATVAPPSGDDKNTVEPKMNGKTSVEAPTVSTPPIDAVKPVPLNG